MVYGERALARERVLENCKRALENCENSAGEMVKCSVPGKVKESSRTAAKERLTAAEQMYMRPRKDPERVSPSERWQVVSSQVLEREVAPSLKHLLSISRERGYLSHIVYL